MQSESRLRGKMIKDYTLNQTISQYGQESEVVHAFKNQKSPVTVYAIRQAAINAETFIPYNNEVAANSEGIFPSYLQVVKSQNFLYMVFEDLSHPFVDPNSLDSISKMLSSMQKLLQILRNKIGKQQIFMKKDGSYRLCYLPPYSKFQNKTSNLYSKFHNKSVLAELFCEMVPTSNKTECLNRLIDNFQNQNLLSYIQALLPIHQQKNNFPKKEEKIKSKVKKSVAASILKEANDEYPDIDDEEFQQLVAQVHVNRSLKNEAEEAFMRLSQKARQNQQDQQENKEIKSIMQNVKHSMFDIKYNKSKMKSKYQIKLNERKEQESEFQIYFTAYTSIFKLFKKTIKSYLTIYKKGFTGIITVYLLTIIMALRKISLINDLNMQKDVFNIGPYIQKMDFTKYKNELKKELVKEARIIATLKNRIEGSSMPYKTFETLMPYLEDDLELVQLTEIQRFCFFFMTTLIKVKNRKSYHEILALETMYILLNNEGHEIVYSEADMPSYWRQDYYEEKKTLINALVPSWSI